MNILIAPDSFKGSLSSVEVCKYIKRGINNFEDIHNIKTLPLADGGEGTVEALVNATGGQIINKEVTGPRGNKVNAQFGIIDNEKTAVIEMASASGLPLVPLHKRDPSITTTYGTGQLIKKALDYEIEEIIIGIGGSATNDAGVGMAQALGIKFLDKNNEEIGFGGKNLKNIQKIDNKSIDQRIKKVDIKVACDVNNPLYGLNGAAYVYAPQKGADQNMIKMLDKNLRYFNKIVKKELNKDLNKIKGAGAAGGLGAGLVSFLDAELHDGIELILDLVNFDYYVKDVDLVITGEGMLDGQSINGKTPVGVARRAKKHGKPVIAITGSLGKDVQKVIDEGIDSYFSIIDKPDSLNSIMERSKDLLINTSEQIIRSLTLIKEVI